MSARPRLLVLATAASLLALALVLTCLQAVSALVAVPTSWWGPSQLSAALVALASAAGAAGAAWHALSALLALLVLPARGRRRAAAPAQRLLARWGAPWVRRILVGTLSLSAVTAPALAAVPTPDDLGWRPTQSAPAPAPQAADDVAAGDPAAGDPATGPAPEDTAGPSPADPAAPGTAPGGTAPPGGLPSGAAPSSPTAPGPQGAPPGAPGYPGAPGSQGSPAPGAEEEATAPAPAGTGASHGTRATGSHTVRPGESLWSITADLLHTTDRGAIASAWPTLWAANRVVVGRDPGLIRPGTVLQVPEALRPA